MSTPLPVLFAGLVDDAAVYPPGSMPLHEAVKAHRRHRAAWYADFVGPLLVPASAAGQLTEDFPLGVVADRGIDSIRSALAQARSAGRTVRQAEFAVAKRGEDPQPALAEFLALLREYPGVTGYAEIPLTWGLLSALDTVASARGDGLSVAPKFRTGGLAAELFPTPIELGAVICACRDRALPFKLTAGLHHAIRHTDPETGFVHHGFLNILVGAAQAVDDAEVADVAATLAGTDPVSLIEATRRMLTRERPLWVGFGSCSVTEPLDDLSRLGLLG